MYRVVAGKMAVGKPSGNRVAAGIDDFFEIAHREVGDDVDRM